MPDNSKTFTLELSDDQSDEINQAAESGGIAIVIFDQNGNVAVVRHVHENSPSRCHYCREPERVLVGEFRPGPRPVAKCFPPCRGQQER